MTTFPITLLLFLTTKGYSDCCTIYRTMLDGWDRQLPLSTFGLLYAHIKITPGEEWIAEVLSSDLRARGFIVESATGDWVRGQNHFLNYLSDQIKVSKDLRIYDNPFVFFIDHDYVPVCHVDTFDKVIYRMCRLVDSSPEVLTARFLREEDVDSLAPDRTVEIETDKNIAWSKHVNFQPMILRTIDFYRVCKIIEDNWETATKMHGEALWREVLRSFSRSPKQHAVWLPEYAQVVNLGVPNYQEVAKRLNLQIYPNPIIQT